MINTSMNVSLIFRKVGVYPAQCNGLVDRLRGVCIDRFLPCGEKQIYFLMMAGERVIDAGHLNGYGGDGVAGPSH